ncbi:hypothetical protein PFICI_03897 [Pestalotiopsis fici W106-1]|uniref:Enoyl reductase (ER) domain-containing protein n=1 Tax=Pestalotiopsis fici (strain W106-1 / CGMCC3.15140) TaxID=1229662 RepID=W3XK82_PESFW|nr:uncharacterized protein PFICI_03897 [Pestalotiopsis fici W106-1]ETS85872.1 hypothetical protein PFICI_03897 [Pestalotiopsis fici W106-1]
MDSKPDTAARAIVSRGPLSEGQWAIEPVTLKPLKENELKIQVLSVGVCHTDLTVGNTPREYGAYPGVLGHEGCGIVLDVGPKVKVAKVGDRVLLSFRFCKDCFFCKNGHPSYCSMFTPLNMGFGDYPREFATGTDGASVKGFFFGQSSFSEVTIVSETSVINMSGYVDTDEELKLLAPLGCGMQTGAGAVMQLQSLDEDDSIAIFGLGAVGFSAVAAAKHRGVKTIIVIDLVQSRLDLAKSFGATHALNPSLLKDKLTSTVKGITGGLGTSVTIDATGNVNVIKQAINITRNQGEICMLGVPPPGTILDIDITSFLGSGKKLFGSVEGGVVPSEV